MLYVWSQTDTYCTALLRKTKEPRPEYRPRYPYPANFEACLRNPSKTPSRLSRALLDSKDFLWCPCYLQKVKAAHSTNGLLGRKLQQTSLHGSTRPTITASCLSSWSTTSAPRRNICRNQDVRKVSSSFVGFALSSDHFPLNPMQSPLSRTPPCINFTRNNIPMLSNWLKNKC